MTPSAVDRAFFNTTTTVEFAMNWRFIPAHNNNVHPNGTFVARNIDEDETMSTCAGTFASTFLLLIPDFSEIHVQCNVVVHHVIRVFEIIILQRIQDK
ncbi:hypothetical protein I4U23_003936 [Adineta vaga]|nr:hypothetical protein I4U23_003936 [Adineta vaga]